MSIFGKHTKTAKTLKSIYMSIFGLKEVVNTPQTLAVYGFQSIHKGAHLFVCICPVKKACFSQYLQRCSSTCAWASMAKKYQSRQVKDRLKSDKGKA